MAHYFKLKNIVFENSVYKKASFVTNLPSVILFMIKNVYEFCIDGVRFCVHPNDIKSGSESLNALPTEIIASALRSISLPQTMNLDVEYELNFECEPSNQFPNIIRIENLTPKPMGIDPKLEWLILGIGTSCFIKKIKTKKRSGIDGTNLESGWGPGVFWYKNFNGNYEVTATTNDGSHIINNFKLAISIIQSALLSPPHIEYFKTDAKLTVISWKKRNSNLPVAGYVGFILNNNKQLKKNYSLSIKEVTTTKIIIEDIIDERKIKNLAEDLQEFFTNDLTIRIY